MRPSAGAAVSGARPRLGAGGELWAWLAIRLSGLLLFALALLHFAIVHFVFDPATETAEWIIEERWSSLLWRSVDWLMLLAALVHGILGVRLIARDRLAGRVRTGSLAILYLGGAVLAVLGTSVVLALPLPAP